MHRPMTGCLGLAIIHGVAHPPRRENVGVGLAGEEEQGPTDVPPWVGNTLSCKARPFGPNGMADRLAALLAW